MSNSIFYCSLDVTSATRISPRRRTRRAAVDDDHDADDGNDDDDTAGEAEVDRVHVFCGTGRERLCDTSNVTYVCLCVQYDVRQRVHVLHLALKYVLRCVRV